VVEGLEEDPGIASVAAPVAGAGDAVLIGAVPTSAAASAGFGDTVERLRDTLPPAALVGGAAAENHDLESALAARAPLAIGLVVGLGFLLLLIAFQAPLVAAIAVLANLLSTAAAFGVAKLIFQDGHLSGLLGFESQGFLDAWGPIFFFAMIFAIAMDYTVFLLSSAREQ
jgi:RND superfamily putative drug exporter